MKQWIAILTAWMLLMNCMAALADETNEGVKELFSERDLTQDYKTDKAVPIDLDAQSGTLTITAEGIYVLTGTMNGQVRVAVPEDAKVQLVLSNAHISSGSAAAIVA